MLEGLKTYIAVIEDFKNVKFLGKNHQLKNSEFYSVTSYLAILKSRQT